MDERKQPTALYIVIILGALLCYVLGLAPACWLSSKFGGEKFVTVAYRPVTFVAEATNNVSLMDAICWYSGEGTNNPHFWTFSPAAPGHAAWEPLFNLSEINDGPVIKLLLAPESPERPSSP